MQVELVAYNPPNQTSGIGRYYRELFQNLKDRVDIRMAFPRFPPLSDRFTILRNFPLGILNHQPGSIVHFTQIMGCAQMLWYPVHPAIATVHDLGMLAWPPEANMFRAMDRLLVHLSILGLKRMDFIVAVSRYTRQTVIQQLKFPAERVRTAYPGHDNQLFRPIVSARERLAARYPQLADSKHKYLLYVGSELPRKNLATLLEAVSLLPSNVRLVKIGPSGGARFRADTKELMTRYKLEDRVLFFEQVPESELPLFYSAADVYVCASLLEGFGLPIVESMACRTPIVCSNVASLPEVAGNAAALVPPADAHAFAEAISQVLSDETLHAEMASAGLRRAAAFTWEKTADAVAAVYDDVIRSDRKHR